MIIPLDDHPFIDRIELKYIYFLRFIRAICGMFRMLKNITGGISSYVVLNYLQERESISRGSTCEVFHHSMPSMAHHVSTQITSFRGCIVAQIAFVALIVNVCFQMTESGRCIVTLLIEVV